MRSLFSYISSSNFTFCNEVFFSKVYLHSLNYPIIFQKAFYHSLLLKEIFKEDIIFIFALFGAIF